MNDREALQDLVTSKGWLLFKEWARVQWGPEGYGRQIAGVMHRYADNTDKLAVELGKVHYATEEINALMKWPDEQLKKGEPKEELPVSMHRGGR